MKAVLATYKDRLVNISGRNRSLVLRKIYKKRTFDIVASFAEQEQDLDGLITSLLQDEKKATLIIDDPYKTRMRLTGDSNEQLEIDKEEEIQSLNNVLKKQESLSHEDEEIIRKRRSEIQEKYDVLASEESRRIESIYENLLSMSNHINYLYRETLAIEKETGKYDLYIGYPFVEGRFKDGSFVRAPFYLFPVELEVKNNRWYIRNNPARDPMVNKVFLFAAQKCQQSSIKVYDTPDFSELTRETLVQHILQELDDMGMVCQPFEYDYAKLTSYTNATVPNYKYGELRLIPYVVAGQFPISNSIYTDYELLEDEEDYNESLKELLTNVSVNNVSEGFDFSKIDLPRKDLFTIAPIDFSQETAIKALTKTNQLVIYGPPGTGKSQTIGNMISDALAKGKKILMVSQKRAALDVLYNRLSPIQAKLMLIHDANKDKNKFYTKLRSQIEDGFDYISHNGKIEFEENAIKVDSLLDELKLLEHELTHKRPFGISLQQMYMKTKGIFSQEDPRYSYYKKFREDNPFMDVDYDTLNSSFEKLNKQPFIVDTYFKYARLIEEFSYLPVFSRPMTFMEKEGVIDVSHKIETYQKDLTGLDKIIVAHISKYYTVNRLILSDKELSDYAKGYNKEINHGLIDNDKAKWWNVPKVIGYALKSNERKNNMTKFLAEEAKYKELFAVCGHLFNQVFSDLKELLELMNSDGRKRVISEIKDLSKMLLCMEGIKSSLTNQDYYNELLVSIHALDVSDLMLLEYSFDHASNVDEMGIMLDNLFDFIILEHIHRIEKTEGFNEFYLYFNRFNQIIDEINDLSSKNETLTASIVTSLWNDKMQLFQGDASYKELKRQAEKKRRLWPIRNMIFEFSTMLLNMYPCWLMSPETVSDVLPLQADMFDLIIFDEASQMFVENAIPTIYRGAKVVVAGDDKQLRPTSTFMSRFEEDDEEFLDIETAAALEEESLLDLAKVNYDQVHLNYHYRSRFSELIQFSNHAFYGARLNVSPNRIKFHYDGSPAIERIKVKGFWENRRNSVEANRIVDLVDHLLKNRNDSETIGIITFNINQKDLIEDLLDARCQIDETFKSLYQEELVRKKKDEDVSIFVKNIENVQGDERDIIIFSVGYAANKQGKISVNFGSLSQDGGENRLNVAVSRAKKKTYVVTSIEPEELYVSKTKNDGAKLFRKYLEYAKVVSDKQFDKQEMLLEHMAKSKSAIFTEDEFRDQLASRLRELGLSIETKVGSGKYALDLAVWDDRHQAFVLGIECDSTLYGNEQTTLERDIYRSRFYKARSWDVVRVWAYDWWRNPNQVLEMIRDHLDSHYQIEVDIDNPPLQTTEYHMTTAPAEDVCWYGDRIQLKDMISGEIFTIDIDVSEENKDQLNEFKKLLINEKVGASIVYRDYEYILHQILKRS